MAWRSNVCRRRSDMAVECALMDVVGWHRRARLMEMSMLHELGYW